MKHSLYCKLHGHVLPQAPKPIPNMAYGEERLYPSTCPRCHKAVWIIVTQFTFNKSVEIVSQNRINLFFYHKLNSMNQQTIDLVAAVATYKDQDSKLIAAINAKLASDAAAIANLQTALDNAGVSDPAVAQAILDIQNENTAQKAELDALTPSTPAAGS